ncbi:hypothetical protein J577_0612 [Acinetobacter sp. 263903-1]|nr:hypothetical protein J538_1626 [Acinetobacter sp. 272263]EXE60739.1 hypothetical protein J579_0055 [Acinetobacter sp. 1239920]KCX38704.1 hypothetical protein J577_0612 [Acinetobacter sp. 263903-1]
MTFRHFITPKKLKSAQKTIFIFQLKIIKKTVVKFFFIYNSFASLVEPA